MADLSDEVAMAEARLQAAAILQAFEGDGDAAAMQAVMPDNPQDTVAVIVAMSAMIRAIADAAYPGGCAALVAEIRREGVKHLG